MTNYKGGSIWRKWDTHVHTPESVLKNDFGTDWDLYVKTLFKKAIEHEISGIGITDYYLIDGYRKLKSEYLDNEGKLKELFDESEINKIKEIYVFPNLEFRIGTLILSRDRDLKWNRKINYHVIVSDEISPDDIESDFISQLSFIDGSEPGQSAQRSPLTKSNLRAFGEKLIKEHQGFSGLDALFVGMMNASVDENEIVEKLSKNSKFKGRYLLGLPIDEDLSAVSWDSQGHSIRKNFIRQMHFASSSNPGTINFLLGGNDKRSHISEFGPIKPCLWGSDAHDLNKLFIPDERRNTWIKADLCFEGLKQVYYDPESRVRIQEGSPQNKSSYQTIDKVRFLDDRNEPEFPRDWIELNPDLNTIIGGKSSGKSLLLHYIAKSINRDEVISKCAVANSQTYDTLDKDPKFNFEVIWKNGDSSQLNLRSESKSITYIPQLYINHLAEQPGREQLNGLIEKILRQNSNFDQFMNEIGLRRRNISDQISAKISLLLSQRESFRKLTAEAATIGKKVDIQKEIATLQETIKKLRESSGFTEEQESVYKSITSRQAAMALRRQKLEAYLTTTKQAKDAVLSDGKYQINEMSQRLLFGTSMSEHSSSFPEKLALIFTGELEAAHQRFVEYLDFRARKIPKSIAIIDKELDELLKKITPLLEKVNDRKTLNEKQESLKKEETKVATLEAKLAQIQTMIAQGQNTLKVSVHSETFFPRKNCHPIVSLFIFRRHDHVYQISAPLARAVAAHH